MNRGHSRGPRRKMTMQNCRIPERKMNPFPLSAMAAGRIPMLFLLLVSFAVHPFSASGAVRFFDLEKPEHAAIINQNRNAVLTRDFEHVPVLTVTLPPGTGSGGKITFPLPMEELRGKQLFFEADVMFRNISRPVRRYHGVKFMAHVKGRNGETWPQHWFARKESSGDSKGWIPVRFSVDMSGDPASVSLVVGLEEVSGSMSIKNIRILSGTTVSRSIFCLQEIPQAVYTKKIPRMRGFMSGSFQKAEEVSEDYFRGLRSSGANTLRLQLKVPWNEEDRILDDTFHKEWFERMFPVIRQTLALGKKYSIGIVIDNHYSSRFYFSNPSRAALFAQEWRRIAETFRESPALCGYDLLNEPHSRYLNYGTPAYPAILGKAIEMIRAVDPSTPVIVEADFMASPEKLEYLPVYPQTDILYSVHFYFPGALTHQLELKKKPFLRYPSGEWNKQALRGAMQKVRRFQQATGAEIFIGEFGGVRWAPGIDRYYRDVIELFEEFGWHWCYHAFRESDAFDAEIDSTEPVRIWSEADRIRARGRKNPRWQILTEAMKRRQQNEKKPESSIFFD